MIKWILFVILVIPNVSLGYKYTTSSDFSREDKFSFSLETGYRRDNLNWNIASDLLGVTSPNILSELTWRDIESYSTKASFYLPFRTNWGSFFLDAGITYAYSFSGENQDSDFNEDNRVDEWSRSINKIDGTYFVDYEVNLGYKLFKSRFIDLSSIAGFGYYTQFLKLKNLHQVISGTNNTGRSQPPAVGTTDPTLNSSYYAEWNGFNIGLSLSLKPTQKQSLKITGKYFPIAEYYGEGNWNLRNFIFKHGFTNNIQGFHLNAKYGLTLHRRFLNVYSLNGQKKTNTKFVSLYVCIDYKTFKTDSGLDATYQSGQQIGRQKLNEVNWNTLHIAVGINFEI